MIEWNIEDVGKDDLCIMHLEGKATLESVGELKAALADLLDSKRQVAVNLNDLSDLDLAGLQLFCSAHRSFISRGRKFTLLGCCHNAFQRVTREAGFNRHQSCVFSPEEGNCLWIPDDN